MEHTPEKQEFDANEDSDSKSAVKTKNEQRKRQAKGWIISLAAAILIAFALRFFVFEFVRVEGKSMQPTLYKDEYVFMERVSYWFSPPQRGDIVICSFPNSKDSYIKRVIGLPGDRVSVNGGILYINGVANFDYFGGAHEKETEEIIVPDNCVVVMGDNRNDSTDSREPFIGPIPYAGIQGKAAFIIWPFDKIHGI